MRSAFLLSSVAAAVAACCLYGQAASRGTVTGTVTLQGGAAVAAARIAISSSVSAGYEGIAATDSSGRFTVPDVPCGNVTVSVRDAKGVTRARATGILRTQGETVTLSVVIPPGS